MRTAVTMMMILLMTMKHLLVSAADDTFPTTTSDASHRHLRRLQQRTKRKPLSDVDHKLANRLYNFKVEAQALSSAGGYSPKIINGQNAVKGRYPYFVHLRGSEGCGGALIANDLVLTAAHCIGLITFGRIGSYDTGDVANEPGGSRPIVAEVVHPEWTGSIPYNDVMIVKLGSVVDSSVSPYIRLNRDEDVPAANTALTMIGFGATEPDQSEFPKILQETTTDYVPFEECAIAADPISGAKYGLSPDNTAITPDWFCTLRSDISGDSFYKTGPCFGDSGGPIILQNNPGNIEGDVLVGSISGAVSCNNPYLPDMNQRVSHHYDWIVKTGCELSVDPPPYWNCPGSVAQATPEPVGPTPTKLPTPAPITPSTPPPTPPSITQSTPQPTPQPVTQSTPQLTPPPATQSTPPPTPFPTKSPTPLPTPSPIAQPTPQPTPAPVLTASPISPGDLQLPVLPPISVEQEPIRLPVSPLPPPPVDEDGNPYTSLLVLWTFDEKASHIGWVLADADYMVFQVGVPNGRYVDGTQTAQELVYAPPSLSGFLFLIDNPHDRVSDSKFRVEYEGQVLAVGMGGGNSETKTYFGLPDP